MPIYANITPTADTGGLPYAVPAAALPVTEGDLFNQPAPVFDPVPVRYNCAVLAFVQLVISGGPSGNTAYVVLQTDLGDNNWVDVAWIVTTSTSNSTLNFVLSGGVAGANAVALTRANGTAPGASGSNQLPIGGRIRFTGQATLTGGTVPKVTAYIKYKMLPLK